MASFEHDGARVHYVESGDPAGFPVLLIAPGGLRSSIGRWGPQPWNPLLRLDPYRLIAMDQRNAGQSTGPIPEDAGWHSYTADQLALLDHLGVGEFAVVGMCIGGPYTMGLARTAPDRVRAAVMLQPIGLADNRDAFLELFNAWRGDIEADHPEVDGATWERFRQAMFGGDFLFNTSRAQAAACTTPILIAMGNDRYHPASVSRELAMLLPNADFVEHWKEPEHREAADSAIREFLARHC